MNISPGFDGIIVGQVSLSLWGSLDPSSVTCSVRSAWNCTWIRANRQVSSIDFFVSFSGGRNKVLNFVNKFPGWHSDDPRWIGAWWLGCLIMAVIIALLALVVGAFPRQLQRADGRSGHDESCDMQVAPAATVSTLDLEQPSTKELKGLIHPSPWHHPMQSIISIFPLRLCRFQRFPETPIG